MSIGETFRALHQKGNPFILANVWDVGSARVMAALGAKALATSSAAYGFTLGLPDGGKMTRDVALAHAADIIAATDLPVQGDFEDGFGEAPETVAETVRLAAEAGLAGICVEDTMLPGDEAYDFDLAVERIRAGAAAARALPADFVFTARADGMLTGSYDLDEAIRRLQAFEAAGADVLYAPRTRSLEAVRQISEATTAPLNVLVVGETTAFSRDQLAQAGAARLSLGSTLARATHRTLIDASKALLEDGDFAPLTNVASSAETDALLLQGSAKTH